MNLITYFICYPHNNAKQRKYENFINEILKSRRKQEDVKCEDLSKLTK